MKKILAKAGDGVTCPIAVFVKDGKVLTGLRNYTKDKWKEISVWTFPGGRSSVGETIEETLRREVAEEVGVTEFEVVDFIGEVSGAKKGDIVPMFFCATAQEAKLLEPEKFSEWRWVPIKEYAAEESYRAFNPTAIQIIVNYLLNLK